MALKKKIILIVSITLLAINVWAIYNFSVDNLRLVRLCTSTIFLVFFAILGGLKNVKLFIVLILFCISDVFILRYDELLYNNATSILSTLGYLVLASYLIPRFSIKNMHIGLKVAFSGILLVSAYVFYEVIGLMSQSLKSELHRYLYYLYSLVLLGLLVLGGNYFFRYNTTKSLYCLCFIFSFVVSDLFAALSYYSNLPLFYYPTRFFIV
ncbi:hypothetical protein [Formosa haliotis]|uniref:hypothetical protein n=1 Tax=Formosa haliotis TaxID=1555194 RepID=UPI0011468148|nr:hypothetical protein [Formosa haliotis]